MIFSPEYISSYSSKYTRNLPSLGQLFPYKFRKIMAVSISLAFGINSYSLF